MTRRDLGRLLRRLANRFDPPAEMTIGAFSPGPITTTNPMKVTYTYSKGA